MGQMRGALATAKRPGVLGAMVSLRKKWDASMPEPIPVFDEPSIWYTTGNTCV